MDLENRIAAQNEEVKLQYAERQLKLQMRARAKQEAAQQMQYDYQTNYEAQPPQQQFQRRQEPPPVHSTQQPSHAAAAPPPLVHNLTELSLREQERELDRQLQLERSLQRGYAADRRGIGGGGGNGGVATQQRAGGARRLTHAAPNPEKENRAKISLLPPKTSGAASTAASIPPSVAASTTASERLRRPVHFTHQMADKAVARSGQMDHFLNPVDGIRGEMRRAGIEPKDHHRENRRMIKEIAAQKQQQKEQVAEQADEERRRRQRMRDQALTRAHATLTGLAEEDSVAAPRTASAGRRSVRPPPTGQLPPPPPSRPHEPGHVPAYLQRRKAEWAAVAQEEAARAAAEAECPPGLRLVGEEEKSRILAKLGEEKAKAELELRQLPFVIKTNATQQKKDRLEARLEEIDGAEQAYQQEKVFVPADM